MSNWGMPSQSGKRFITIPTPDTANSRISSAYTTGAANTLGSVTEIDSSLDHDAWGVWVTLHGGTATSYLANILIGAATEDVLIPNLMLWNARADDASVCYFFPIHIPKASRLAISAQAVGAASTLYYQVAYQLAPFPGLWYGTRVTAIGADTANSRGTLISQNASSNSRTRSTLGAMVNPIRHLVVGQRNLDTTVTATRYVYDLAHAAGNTVFYTAFCASGGTPDFLEPRAYNVFNLDIPVSGNITVNSQASVAGAEGLYMIAYGVD